MTGCSSENGADGDGRERLTGYCTCSKKRQGWPGIGGSQENGESGQSQDILTDTSGSSWRPSKYGIQGDGGINDDLLVSEQLRE